MIIILFLCILPLTIGENNCCLIKRVLSGPLEGVYNLKEGRQENEDCMDDCLYTSDVDGDDYCFSNVPTFPVECIDKDGTLARCYIGQPCNTTKCLSGYECCPDDFCCIKTCPPKPEDKFNSLVASDAFCVGRPECKVNSCPVGYECCHDDYCCPKICPPTEEDTVNALETTDNLIKCSTCDKTCEEGATKFKDLICSKMKNYVLKRVCKLLLKNFTLALCDKFCKQYCKND